MAFVFQTLSNSLSNITIFASDVITCTLRGGDQRPYCGEDEKNLHNFKHKSEDLTTTVLILNAKLMKLFADYFLQKTYFIKVFFSVPS